MSQKILQILSVLYLQKKIKFKYNRQNNLDSLYQNKQLLSEKKI